MDQNLDVRYIVFKIKDLEGAINAEILTPGDLNYLSYIEEKVDDFRRQNRRQDSLSCVVVESDWPMYKETVEKILSS